MPKIPAAVRRCPLLLCSLVLALLVCGQIRLLAQPAAAGPATMTHAVHDFADIDAIMNEAVAKGNIPGGVVLVGHNGSVVYRKAFGSRSLEPTREAMTVDTIFDLASLTKCIATTTAVMQLIEEGRVRLNEPVAAYLPEFAQNGKGQITVRELMTHFSGLPPDLDLKQPWQGRAAAFSMAMQAKPMYQPGTRFLYSDINFETLGFLVEKISGMTLDKYAAAKIFKPLGMNDTTFLPPASWSARIAPTQYDEQGKMLRGTVHDPTTRRMGGVAGHAGLFSTADDLAIFAQELLSGERILSRLAIEKMSTPQQPANSVTLRGLGWDIDSPFSSNRGELLPVDLSGTPGSPELPFGSIPSPTPTSSSSPTQSTLVEANRRSRFVHAWPLL